MGDRRLSADLLRPGSERLVACSRRRHGDTLLARRSATDYRGARRSATDQRVPRRSAIDHGGRWCRKVLLAVGLVGVVAVCAPVARALGSSPGLGLSSQSKPLGPQGGRLSEICPDPGTTPSGSADLFCVELYATAAVPEATGIVEMRRAATPFGVSVSAAGNHRYDLTAVIEGLPDPGSLGDYTAYVVWATTPLLRPMVRLAEIGNGRTEIGPVEFNKFFILISAEKTATGAERQGRLALRGISPSSRMQTHDLLTLAPAAILPSVPADAAVAEGQELSRWQRPPTHPAISMIPGMMGLEPRTQPYLPRYDPEVEIPWARPRQIVKLGDGGTLDLESGPVRRTLKGRELIMYGFNGQYPGPLIHVQEKTTLFVNFTNRIGLPTTIHWHGVRLDNRFDGVPGVTQEPVDPGQSFRYRIFFPDAGLYWYHPHYREDIQQDLGLYGNMLVDSPLPNYYNSVHREEVLMLDDLLIGERGLVPYGEESANYMLMGRFGNLLLVNGEPDYELRVQRGEVVRFFLTNVANTRTFNVHFGGVPIKVVGSDVSKFEREQWVDSVVIAPAERYIVEVQFDDPGEIAITNNVQAINHRIGTFFPEIEGLGVVQVAEQPAAEDHTASFRGLREHGDVIADIDRYRAEFGRAVDHELLLSLEVEDLPLPVEQLMRLDSIYFNPVEWSGTMPIMNWVSTDREVRWILRDRATKMENTDIRWRFKVGDIVKIRLHNDRNAFHAMQHPIHLHGQRFLVVQQDGVANDNLAWKDTLMVPVGSTVDILLELSNPGRWMAHCHIAEHLESGMRFIFEVE